MTRSTRRRSLVIRSLIGVSCLVLVGLIVSWLVGGALVAPQPRLIGAPPADLLADSFTIPSETGSQISGWHIHSDASDGVVVLLHGIRGSRLSMLDRARLLHDAGYSVVMIDLQAHGESPGDHIAMGHLERHDVRAAVEFARRQHPDESIGVVGVSLGGAAALLALPLDIDALVVESVFPTIEDAIGNRVAARLGPFSSLPTTLLLVQLKPRLGISASQLRPIDCISHVDCPIYVVSGTADVYTTVAETRRFFSGAREPKELWLVDGAAHEDLCRATSVEYGARIVGFLDRHVRDDRQLESSKE